jgi:predicted AlkP superfamily pyrophosphatase or phosphodiesterase
LQLSSRLAALAAIAALAVAAVAGAQPPARNAIIFIADGLRHDAVNATDAPTFVAVRREGVELVNSHAVYPTLTTVNAAALATGRLPGDTGDYGNTEYVGFRVFEHGAPLNPPLSPIADLEQDPVLGDVNDRFGGNLLGETSLLSLARAKGFNTASIGKQGPVAIQDVSQVVATKDGDFEVPATVILDDSTGKAGTGLPLSPAIQAALRTAGLSLAPPPREQPPGDVAAPGVLAANVGQQRWFADATTRAVLPAFAASGKPFVLVFWSRDPDGTQHNQGDSLNSLEPGINGPTSRAAITNADANLRQILDFLRGDPQLLARTDVVVTADHGFSTISRHEIDAQGHASASYATTLEYSHPDGRLDVKKGWLPPGFLAIDLAHALGEPLFDPDVITRRAGHDYFLQVDPTRLASATSRRYPSLGNGLIGGTGSVSTPIDARVVVSSNGGSDLVYVPRGDRALVARLVGVLAGLDYVDGIFVDSSFGTLPGALPLSAIGLEGRSQVPRPAIVVSFKSFLRKEGDLLSAVQVTDGPLQEGQGSHGSLARATTFNNMALWGPDFRQGFQDPLPAGNLDIAPTLAHVLGLALPPTVSGRVLTETLRAAGGSPPAARSGTVVSDPAPGGRVTQLKYQEVGATRYLDEAELR